MEVSWESAAGSKCEWRLSQPSRTVCREPLSDAPCSPCHGEAGDKLCMKGAPPPRLCFGTSLKCPAAWDAASPAAVLGRHGSLSPHGRPHPSGAAVLGTVGPVQLPGEEGDGERLGHRKCSLLEGKITSQARGVQCLLCPC